MTKTVAIAVAMKTRVATSERGEQPADAADAMAAGAAGPKARAEPDKQTRHD